MGKPIFCTPNYLKPNVLFKPIIGGGNWDSNNWLDNLQDKYFINKSISNDAEVESTKMEIDLQVMRDIKCVVIPNGNPDNDGRVRVRISNTVAWSDVTVNGLQYQGATTLNITAGPTDITVSEGEIFIIDKDTQIYKVVVGTSLSATTSGSITIERSGDDGVGLAKNALDDEIITCHSGDYVDDLRADTDWTDYRKVIYGLTDPWGSATIWLGKETEENLATLNLPSPFIHIFDNIILGRYVRIELDNSEIDDGFVSLDDCYVTSAFIPSTGISWGSVMGVESNTTSESSAGGVEAFDIEKSNRYIDMSLPGLTVTESVTNIFDMQRKLDTHSDFFFIFDSDDTILMTRRAFAARFEKMGGQQFVTRDWVDNKMRIKEKLG